MPSALEEKSMTIEDVLNDIDSIDDNLVVFVKQPVRLNTEIVLVDQDSIENNNISNNFNSFLEIVIIKEIIELTKNNSINISRITIFE